MLDIVSCSNNLECASLVLISIAPTIIVAIIFTALSLFILKRMNKQDTLTFKVMKITFRAEEALLVLILVPMMILLLM